ncbi:hypothetical protein B0H11DRAFT_2274780 [Mycena galericulata]|nr:hypothetical protein B0H11DRAFT_2274780 [Mycena galericulata]
MPSDRRLRSQPHLYGGWGGAGGLSRQRGGNGGLGEGPKIPEGEFYNFQTGGGQGGAEGWGAMWWGNRGVGEPTEYYPGHFPPARMPANPYSRPRRYGGQGGAGGSSHNVGGKGFTGQGPRIPAEEAHNYDMWGGVGGAGGFGVMQGGEGGVGERPCHTEPLLPPGTQLPNITVQYFCGLFALDPYITQILAGQGFQTVEALANHPSIELRDVGLRSGHIAELRRALRNLPRVFYG